MAILVVDDEPDVREAVARVLRAAGHTIEEASDGESALERSRATDFDALVVDVVMPTLDGLALVRALRRDANRVPVLMLTARDAVGDRVAGLEAGADDYVVKPFALEELVARLKALLRRASPHGDHSDEELRFDTLTLSPASRDVFRDGRRIDLTRTEFSLLEYFLRHPRQVLTRGQLFDHMWGYDPGPGSKALDVHLGYLRRKLEQDGEPRLLHNVRGVGFVLRREHS